MIGRRRILHALMLQGARPTLAELAFEVGSRTTLVIRARAAVGDQMPARTATAHADGVKLEGVRREADLVG